MLDTYEINVNHKLMSAITIGLGTTSLFRPVKRDEPVGVSKPHSELVDHRFTARSGRTR